MAFKFSDAPAGISCFAIEPTAPLGAKVIEKHFILDKNIGGADADFSMDKVEFKHMVKAIRDTEQLIGKVNYSMSKKKTENRRFSRSLYISKDIKKGETLTNKNIKSIRPGYGIHPKYLNDLLGKTVTRDCQFGDRVTMDIIK